MTRICSGYTTTSRGDQIPTCVDAPDGAFVATTRTSCPTGYVYSEISTGGSRFIGVCIPKPQQAAQQSTGPVTITVSPTIQTQVSPQVSPVFQQQFQPSGSPMSAGTAQTSAAPPSGPIGVNSTSMQPSAPAQLPPAPAPSYAAPAPSYAPPPQTEQLPLSPLPSSTPTVPAPQVSPVTRAPAFDWKILAIISAGLVGVMAFSKRK